MTTPPNLPLKKILMLALAITSVISACFYLVGRNAGQGTLITSEVDTMIYMQYAKAIADGTPYIFSPGDTPSTGSTSHLYPVILALLHKLGATGNTLFSASFWLNALFLLGTIANVALFSRKLFKQGWILALALTVFSGQLISAHLGQTDMGLLCLLATSIFTALLYKKPAIYISLMMILGITRPEGMVFSFIFILFSLTRLAAHYRFNQKLKLDDLKQTRLILLSGTLGVIAYGGILLLNHHLTGSFGFMSTVNKGYFNNYPLSSAITLTGHDVLNIYKGFFWGLPVGARERYALPLVAALLGLTGIILRHRKNSSHHLFTELLIAGSAGAMILLIASSGWQGISSDRYLAWIMPFWLLYIAIGTTALQTKLKDLTHNQILPSLLVLFQVSMLILFTAEFHRNSSYRAKSRNFYKTLNDQLPQHSRVGQLSALGYQYFMDNHRLMNISGIETPAFVSDDPAFSSLLSFEAIKHTPDLKFDYWVLSKGQADTYPYTQFATNQLFEASEQLGLASMMRLYETQWSSLDGGTEPVLVKNELRGKTQTGMLDIGYDIHRKKYTYSTFCRLSNTRIRYGICTHPLGDLEAYTEVGLPIIGYEVFTVPIDPAKELLLVLRTGRKLDANIRTDRNATATPEISSPVALNVMVDDQLISTEQIPLNDEGYTEAIIRIPAEHLTSNQAEIVIGGDHISYAYWFYQ